MATYSQVSDLLIGDLTLGSTIVPADFVKDASDEVDSRLGTIYVVPLVPAEEGGTISEAGLLTLKRIANFIATGRLLMAATIGAEDQTVHAYGKSMLAEGQAVLEQIATGMIDLVGAKRLPPQTPGGDAFNGPTIINYDATSGVDAFYAAVSGGCYPPLVGPVWRPGP